MRDATGYLQPKLYQLSGAELRILNTDLPAALQVAGRKKRNRKKQKNRTAKRGSRSARMVDWQKIGFKFMVICFLRFCARDKHTLVEVCFFCLLLTS